MYSNTCLSSQFNILVIKPGTFSSKTFHAFENSYSDYAGVAKTFLGQITNRLVVKIKTIFHIFCMHFQVQSAHMRFAYT